MKVCEIFQSIQGEGELVGYPTVFIRLTGCNLRCRYCDSEYAFYEGEETSIKEIISKIRAYKSGYICITGGEPLLQEETIDLLKVLLEEGYEVCLETNGSIDVSKVIREFGIYGKKLMLSLDVKCPYSGMSDKMKFDNIKILRDHDQLKFVVYDREDYEYAKKIIRKFKPRSKIIIQPVWGTDYKKIAELMIKDGINARLSLQIHKIIWGEGREI